MSPEQHVARHTLTRLRAGELTAAEELAVSTHLGSCTPCAAKLSELEAEAVRFEVRIPFARFEAGVQARRAHTGSPRRLRWLIPALPLAAAAVLAVLVLPPRAGDAPSRRKGGADVTLAIASATGSQRATRGPAPEALAPGDRVRIGYVPGAHRWVLAVSVDAAGEVTPLYPEAGASLEAPAGPGPHYLPDSLEFTGHGAEAVVVVLSDRPLRVDAAVAAAREAFGRAGGDVARLPPLELAGEQFLRLLHKP